VEGQLISSVLNAIIDVQSFMLEVCLLTANPEQTKAT
jgi:hypothetical protein